jgi:hypothetical protein
MTVPLATQIDIELRQARFSQFKQIWGLIQTSANKRIVELKKELTNQKAQEELDNSLETFGKIIGEIAELAAKVEERDDFNDVIGELELKVFKRLKDSICEELELQIGDGITLEEFYISLFKLLDFEYFKKKFPERSKIVCGIEVEQFAIEPMDFFRRLDTYNNSADRTIREVTRKIGTFLKDTRENCAHAYCDSLDSNIGTISSLRCLRNMKDHRPSCGKDYLYDVVDYGNFYVLTSLVILLAYAYIEIIDRWLTFYY